MRFAELSRKSYFRLFLVYGVFLVLMLLLILPLIGQVTRTLEERSVGNYANELNRNIGRLDGQIDSFAAIVRHIAAESRYARTLHASGDEDHERLLMLRNFQQELYDAASGFDGIRDFAVLTANGAVICRTRIYPVHAGMNARWWGLEFSADETDTPEQFRNRLGTEGIFASPVTSGDWGRYDALILSFPLYGQTAAPIALAFVAMDLDTVMKGAAPMVFAERGSGKICGQTGRVLYASGEDAGDPVSIEATSRYGIRFVFSARRDAIFRDNLPLIRTIRYSVTAMIGGGVLIAAFFAWRNTLPLRRLSDKARAVTDRDAADSRTFYEYLDQSLSGMNREIRVSADRLKEQQRLIENSMLEKALLGNMATASSYRSFTEALPEFPERYCLAMVVIQWPAGSMKDTLARQIGAEELLRETAGHQVYCLNLSTKMFVAILPVQAGPEAVLQTFRKTWTERYRQTVKIYLTDEYAGADNLREAYSQAKRIQHMAIAKRDPARFFTSASFEKYEWNMKLDYTVFQQLYDALVIAEKDNAAASLHRLYLMMPEEPSESVTAATFNRTLDFALSVMLRVKRENFEALKAVELPTPDLNQPLKDYFAVLEGYASELCDVLAEYRKKESDPEGKIIAYIEKHLTDQDLCAKTICSHFGLTENQVQTLMHERRSASLADYIEEQRMQIAAGLLKNTSLTVQQVAERSGFALYNTFYKAMRRKFGASPSEYRERETAGDGKVPAGGKQQETAGRSARAESPDAGKEAV